MNFFKKNKAKETSKTRTRLSLGYSDFPNEALEITYKHLMENYNANPNEQTGRKLQDISKILNDRAYKQGNGKLYQEINEIIPLSQEKFNRMTTPEKENLKRIVKQKQESDESIKKLSEPQPDLDGELDNYENEYGSVDRPSPPQNEVIHQTNYDKNQDEEVVLINEVEVKQTPQQKKMKIPGMNFFKKKKMKKLIHLPPPQPEPQPQTPQTQPEPQPQTPQTPPQPQQTQPEPPKEKTIYEGLEQPKLKGLFNKKPKLKLPNLICPDCMHSIKAHTTKGESSGCKCGCLNTVETIAEKHNVTLEQEQPKESHDDLVLKQAQTLASMKGEPKPIQPPPEPLEEPSTKTRSLCANCDHIPKAHFDGNKFCTVIGCTCETYRAYPE